MAKKEVLQSIPLETVQPLIKEERREYSLDFYRSQNLNEIEAGIRETQNGIQAASLAIALAIVRIDNMALYAQAKYRSFPDYLRQSDTRLNMPKQTVSDLKKIGETYLKNRSALQRIGFKEEGNLHKLRYLEMALQKHDPAEVFKRLKSESFRNFKDFAEGSERSDSQRYHEPQDFTLSATKEGIALDGKPLLSFDPDLPETDRKGISNAVKDYYRIVRGNLKSITFEVASEEEEKEIARHLSTIYKIKETGDTPCIVGVYDTGEAKAIKRKIDSFLKSYREKR